MTHASPANPLPAHGKTNLVKYAAGFLIVLAAGAAGAFFAKDAKLIYENLNLPPFAPSACLFPAVWSVLFLPTGYAFCRVWIRSGGLRPEGQVKNALGYYLIQLVFSIFWNALFFWLELRPAALADLVILMLYVILTTVRFFKIDKAAGILMVPYAVWVAYVLVLNALIAMLN